MGAQVGRAQDARNDSIINNVKIPPKRTPLFFNAACAPGLSLWNRSAGRKRWENSMNEKSIHVNHYHIANNSSSSSTPNSFVGRDFVVGHVGIKRWQDTGQGVVL